MKTEKSRKRLDIIILIITAVLTGLAAVQISKLKIDSSVEVFIPEKNATRIINDGIRREFGSSDSILMGIEARFDKITTAENLFMIEEITAELKSFPGVEDVISLTNMEYIESSSEGMEVLSLLEGTSDEELSLFRYRLNDWQEMYYGTVLSPDETLAAVIVQPENDTSEEEQAAIYEFIEVLAGRYASDNLSFPMAGKPVLKKEISRSVFRDVFVLVPVAAFLIIIVLFLYFRKVEGVLFPILSLAVSCLWVMGLMGLLGLTFTMASILVPVLLLVVGSAYGIHVMAHFYEALTEETAYIDFMKLCGLLKYETGKIITSVILAGVTTAAGFISQLSSPLGPFRIFGIMSAVGIGFSLLTTFFLIPALIRLRYPRGLDPRPFHRIKDVRASSEPKGTFGIFEKLVVRGKLPILLIGLILFGTTAYLIPKITIGTNLIEFFTPDSKMVQDTETFNRKLNGTGNISLAIRSPEKSGVLKPQFLKKLEQFESWLPEQAEQVTKVQSIVPGIRRMNRIMNYDRTPFEVMEEEEPMLDFFSTGGLIGGGESTGSVKGSQDLFFSGFEEAPGLTYEETAALLKRALNGAENNASAREVIEAFLALQNHEGAAFDEIPINPEKYGLTSEEDLEKLLSQYMILYSGSMNMMLNDSLEPDRILITVQLDKEASKDIREVTEEIRNFWDYHLPVGWEYEIAGNSTFNVVLSDLVAKSQLISLAMALGIVWLIMIILFRSIKTGSVGMIPVFFAIAGLFSSMVIFGFNLDIVTSLLAALAVGIGVDYAIHFMTAYRRELAAGTEEPLRAVYRTTGRAILVNASSVALGFLGLLFSRFIPIRQIGILFAVAMIFASLSALVILPMILNHMKEPFKNKTTKEKETEEWKENYTRA